MGAGRRRVIDLLHRRQAGAHDDDAHLALCIEGGGLRGAVSAGMVAALVDLGFTADHFDSVYGSSAGALNAAFFIDGAVAAAMPLYYRDVPAYFLRWSRLLRGQPLVALDRLIDRTISLDRPLDFERVIASGKLRVLATDIGEAALLGKGPQRVGVRCFPPAATPDELRDQLRASTRIPIVGGAPVVITDGAGPGGTPAARAYLDAFLTEGVPLETPVRNGATHVVLLATKPPAAVPREGRLMSAYLRRYLARLNPTLPEQLAMLSVRAAERVTLLERGEAAPDGPAILCVHPRRPVDVPRLRPEPVRILQAIEAGYRQLCADLDRPAPGAFAADPEFRALPAP